MGSRRFRSCLGSGDRLGDAHPDIDTRTSGTGRYNRIRYRAIYRKQSRNGGSIFFSESCVGASRARDACSSATDGSATDGSTSNDGTSSGAAMIKGLILALFLWMQTTVPPLNTTGAATGCNNSTITCTYNDVNVPPGPHFYFLVASNAAGFSGPSQRVDVIVPSGTHNVILNWSPSVPFDSTVTYWIYRGAPPTGLRITGSN